MFATFLTVASSVWYGVNFKVPLSGVGKNLQNIIYFVLLQSKYFIQNFRKENFKKHHHEGNQQQCYEDQAPSIFLA